jgi:aryl-alcohol dehydrogenase-like predicted oxidoreductase
VKFKRLGRSGLKVSELCLGTMQFGWTADEAASFEVLDAFMEAGGNFIDTADIYTSWSEDSYGGKTEEILGRWMKARNNRDAVIMATKARGEMWAGADGEGLSRKHIFRAIEDSLRRLQTDYVDLYQCHWADLDTPIEETLDALNDLVRQGKVRYLGASNYPAWRLMEALWRSDQRDLASFVSYQPSWSLMDRHLFEQEAMPLCKHHGLGVIPYSPLAGGFLTGKYQRGAATPSSVRAGGTLDRYGNDHGWAVIEALNEISAAHGTTHSAVALAWLMANPVCTAPIIGANSTAQLKDQLPALNLTLTVDELVRLNKLTMWPKNWRPIWD